MMRLICQEHDKYKILPG